MKMIIMNEMIIMNDDYYDDEEGSFYQLVGFLSVSIGLET